MLEKKSIKNNKYFSEIDIFEIMLYKYAFEKYILFIYIINIFQFIYIYCNIMINLRELYYYNCESKREKMLSLLKINFCSMKYLNSMISIEEIAIIEKKEKII